MNCPVCQEVPLQIAERQGVEIDYCPRCRGVWLDRGELDKIVERAAGFESERRPPDPDRERRPDYERERRPDYDRERRPDYDRERRYGDDDYRHKRRKGWLGELFDFD